MVAFAVAVVVAVAVAVAVAVVVAVVVVAAGIRAGWVPLLLFGCRDNIHTKLLDSIHDIQLELEAEWLP